MYLHIFCQIALAVDKKLVKGYRAYSNAHTSSINQALRTERTEDWECTLYADHDSHKCEIKSFCVGFSNVMELSCRKSVYFV